ncbi:MAG: protein kinase domain-containing protein [Verrucomicrobiales bacterium]
MNPEEDIFEVAAALPPSERAAYLDSACAGQQDLRARIEALLRADEVTGFMEDHTVTLPGPPVEQSGELIGRYRLLQQIGEGGFGTVWMAEQVEPVTRRVALKIIKAGMDTKEVIARFEAERQALAMMDHPNIARVFDAGATDKGRPFLVMELVKGIPITRFCDEQQFTTRQRLELFADVCSAINHAHQKGVIHRDIKPSNVMVTLNADRPVVKVIDFGIAKATQGKLTDRTLFTRFEQFLGTPAYMSPEQAAISEVDIDTRSDIYALGVLLYELLTGKPPFDAKSLVSAGYEEMRRIIREVEPARPSIRLNTIAGDERTVVANARLTTPEKLSRLVEPDLDWIVMKAIEKDRTRRYETANGLALDIQRFLSDEPVSAGPPSPAYRFRKFARRHKVALRLTTGVAALLIGATTVSIWQAVRATNAENREAQKTADEKAAREDAEAVSKFLTEVFKSPDPARDGRTVAVAEMLDRAANALDTDFATQPERRAKMQGVLGKTYHALGLYREAILLLENARNYFLNQRGKAHADTLNSSQKLADSYLRAGHLTEAFRLREETLAIRRTLNGVEHTDTTQSLADVAESLDFAGRLTEALAMRQEVLALRSKVNGVEHPETIWALHNVGLSRLLCGDELEALKLEEQALALGRKVIGHKHPRTIAIMHRLAECLINTGQHAAALELQKEILALSREVSGPKHSATSYAMENLAYSYYNAGRTDESLRSMEEALEISRGALGPTHPETLVQMASLVNLYISCGSMGRGLPLLTEISSRPPEGTMQSLRVSALLAWYDKPVEHVETARSVLESARDTVDPSTADRAAKGYCLAPSSDSQLLESAHILARRAVAFGERAAYLPWYQLALGMAEYRSGYYSATDAALFAACSGAAQAGSDRSIIEVTAWLYQAMSLLRQGRAPEARVRFAEAEARMKPMPVEGQTLKESADHDDLICWLAYEEARALIFPELPTLK